VLALILPGTRDVTQEGTVFATGQWYQEATGGAGCVPLTLPFEHDFRGFIPGPSIANDADIGGRARESDDCRFYTRYSFLSWLKKLYRI
jgi:hypothetical protein